VKSYVNPFDNNIYTVSFAVVVLRVLSNDLYATGHVLRGGKWAAVRAEPSLKY
jgi:hypothetical protein